MLDIIRLNVQSNMNRRFIIRRIDYIEPEKPSQTKPFPKKIFDLKITNLLNSLTILYPALKRDDSLIRFLRSVGTCRTS